MNETLAHGYSSDSTQRELSNEYQQNRVWKVFKNICILVLWMKVGLALEGLKGISKNSLWSFLTGGTTVIFGLIYLEKN